jgi:hypothetical protein
MATGSIPLTPGAAVLPDGSASNLAPALQRVKSSATAPAPYFLQLAYDAANLESATWSFRMPADYASAPVLLIQYKMVSAVTGNVIMVASMAATSPGDTTDTDAKAFAAVNTSSATAVPATTAGKLGEISITMTNADSVAAGDFVNVRIGRDGASGSDTAAGDLEFVGAALTYTTV